MSVMEIMSFEDERRIACREFRRAIAPLHRHLWSYEWNGRMFWGRETNRKLMKHAPLPPPPPPINTPSTTLTLTQTTNTLTPTEKRSREDESSNSSSEGDSKKRRSRPSSKRKRQQHGDRSHSGRPSTPANVPIADRRPQCKSVKVGLASVLKKVNPFHGNGADRIVLARLRQIAEVHHEVVYFASLLSKIYLLSNPDFTPNAHFFLLCLKACSRNDRQIVNPDPNHLSNVLEFLYKENISNTQAVG